MSGIPVLLHTQSRGVEVHRGEVLCRCWVQQRSPRQPRLFLLNERTKASREGLAMGRDEQAHGEAPRAYTTASYTGSKTF